MSPKLFNILLIMIPVALYYGYIDPMYNGTPGLVWTFDKSIPALKSQNVQYVNSIGQIDLIQETSNSLNKDYKAIDPKIIEKVNILLPRSIDPIKLRNDIVSIASKSGVAISGLQVELDQSDQSYRIAFGVKARYSLFKIFMDNYEKSTRMFILKGLKITHPEAATVTEKDVQDDDNSKLNISVTSKVYFKK